MPENRATRPLLLPALLALFVATGPAAASDCEAAAQIAAREQGIPERLLLAITLAETGRSIGGSRRPWPWAVHSGGQGHWFRTSNEAVTHVEAVLAGGASNIDIGCFQLNLRWHRAGFATLEQMFDPLANARHAAAFLADLWRQTGSWEAATGLYHSRTPVLAERYRTRVATLLAEAAPPAVQIPPRGRRITSARALLPTQGGAGSPLISLHTSGRPLGDRPRIPLIGG